MKQNVKDLLAWAKKRKKEETSNRPKHNKYYEVLENTWNQVINKLAAEAKISEVPTSSEEAKLFSIIDDIDTASDMFKPEMTDYVKYVDGKCRSAHKIIFSDGYNLFYSENKKAD